MVSSLESVHWSRFLARPCLPSPAQKALDAICRQPILITGAGGSIGSALALRLATHATVRLFLLESSESHLFALQRDWPSSNAASRPTFFLGSSANPALLDEIFTRNSPCLVIHAAAFKHVPLLEGQPLAAIENNVFGTQKLLSTAARYGARMVLLSTDKAVEPASVMGATKRIAELITLAAKGIVVRLGNVLASRDSVAEVFARQIAEGGPITVTDPAARRYFLTVDEAVNVILIAATEPHPPALLAPPLHAPHFIADLARFMSGELAPGREIPIDFTHPRPGDKESESLWSCAESVQSRGTHGALGPLCIQSPLPSKGFLQSKLAALDSALDARDLHAALDLLRLLVPEYTPAPGLLALAKQSTSRVSQ